MAVAVRTALRAATPPPRLTVAEWADQKRILSSEASSEPGRWSTDDQPFQREIMDAMGDPAVPTVVFMASSQIGKTEMTLNLVGYHVDQDAAPILVLQPTLEIAKAWSKDRLAPMFRDSPAFRGKIAEVRTRDSDNTLLHKGFIGGHITIAGSNSPASLASWMARCPPLRLSSPPPSPPTTRVPSSSSAPPPPSAPACPAASVLFHSP